jgi:hypothetical protein
MKIKILALLIILLIAGCTSQPIHNISETNLPSLKNGSPPTVEIVQNSIIKACKERGWIPSVTQPGIIEARLTLRSHRAVVEISYTDNSYTITYKDSENLDYSNGSIHRNYNNWVANLSRSIQEEIGAHAQGY